LGVFLGRPATLAILRNSSWGEVGEPDRQDRARWTKGSIKGCEMEGHRLGQTVAYGGLGNKNPAPITPSYEGQADP
jgi:hypothetical protein